jgi:hypothetical protein
MSNMSGGSQADPARGSILLAPKKGLQIAQVGRCRDFGNQQNCRATWDMRDKHVNVSADNLSWLQVRRL